MTLLDSLGLGDSGNSGDSSLTPESIAQRRRLAEALLQQGQSDAPVRHWSQGANRVLQSMLGTYRLGQLDKQDREGSKAANSQIASIFGGGAASPSSPAITPSSPVMAHPQPATPAQGAAAAAGRTPPPSGPLDAAAFIKHQEGYAPVAKWDVRQNSGGYGSKAEPGETFTPEKAEQYLQRDMQPSMAWIDQNLPNATPAQRTALASFGYNLGTDDLDKLLPDIKRGDWATVGRRMLSFNNAATGPGGALEVNKGLTARRIREAALLQGGGASAAPASADPLVPPSAASQLQRQALELMKNPRNAALGRELLIKAAMAEAPKDPESIREYALAVKQGYAKPFMDYQIELKRAGHSTEAANKPVEINGRLVQKQQDGSFKAVYESPPKPTQLQAADKKEIIESDQAAQSGKSAVKGLNKALELNDQAYAGPLAQTRGWISSLFGSEGGKATEAVGNIITAQALDQLKAVFGGMPTEGERKILLDIQGSTNQAPAVRKAIWERAIDMAEQRISFNERQSQALRSGEYYQPGYSPAIPERAPGGALPAPANQAGPAPKRIMTQEEHVSLPPGTPYIDPNGTLRVKQ